MTTSQKKRSADQKEREGSELARIDAIDRLANAAGSISKQLELEAEREKSAVHSLSDMRNFLAEKFDGIEKKLEKIEERQETLSAIINERLAAAPASSGIDDEAITEIAFALAVRLNGLATRIDKSIDIAEQIERLCRDQGTSIMSQHEMVSHQISDVSKAIQEFSSRMEECQQSFEGAKPSAQDLGFATRHVTDLKKLYFALRHEVIAIRPAIATTLTEISKPIRD